MCDYMVSCQLPIMQSKPIPLGLEFTALTTQSSAPISQQHPVMKKVDFYFTTDKYFQAHENHWNTNLSSAN